MDLIVSHDEFIKTISNNVSCVYFYATWCNPCKLIGPKLLEISKNYETIKFAKVDVDMELENVVDEFKISKLPTVIIFKDGKQVLKYESIKEVDIILINKKLSELSVIEIKDVDDF